MIEERALIVGVTNDQQQPMALLEVERKTACGLCGQTRGCGNRIWGKLFHHQQGQFSAKNSIQAAVGQSVIVAIDERSVMHAALLLYFLPIVTMLIVAAIAQALFENELAGLAGALVGLCGSLFWVKGFLAARPHGFSHPEIVRLANAQVMTLHKATPTDTIDKEHHD